MQISLILHDSIPLELAVFKAAQSAMSTILLANAKSLDLSRLSLIRFSTQINSAPKSVQLTTQGEITFLKDSVAGRHSLVTIELSETGQNPFAFATFEIIDRKRGLKSAILQNLWHPEIRITDPIHRKFVTLENIFEKFPDLYPGKNGEEKWPLVALLAAGLENQDREQGTNIQINFSVFGSANWQTPCEIARSESLGAKPGLIEIIQENVLIAQLN